MGDVGRVGDRGVGGAGYRRPPRVGYCGVLGNILKMFCIYTVYIYRYMNCKINNRRGTTPRHPTLGARSPTPAAGCCGVPHAKRISALLLGYPTPPTFTRPGNTRRALVDPWGTTPRHPTDCRLTGHYPTAPGKAGGRAGGLAGWQLGPRGREPPVGAGDRAGQKRRGRISFLFFIAML
jgi:hypothetical protein